MSPQLTEALTLGAAVGSALVAGIFFAFSTFVMNALGRVKPEQGITVMQMINITVINPWFMIAFFGTGVTGLIVAIPAMLGMSAPLDVHHLAGIVLYVVGCIAVTVMFNVPLNNALAVTDAENPESVPLWHHYLRRWTVWNHVRTAASLAAAALLVV